MVGVVNQVDFLIIGGGAAGTTAAQVLRSLSPNSSISIITDENYEFYSRVLLPNYIRGEIPREKLFFKNEAWYQDNRIELVRKNPAKKLISADKILELADGEQYKYGKLLIAIGAKPIVLKNEGSDFQNIFYMWTLDDADRIIEASKGAKKGVVIGGGFIGLEFAHSFKVKGIKTTILEGAAHYWGNRLDEESSKVLQNILEENGIKVVCGDLVEKFIPKDNSSNVGSLVTKSGQEFESDLVGIGIGIRSDLSWLSGSGIKIDNGIVTNEYLETNLPDVYAAGDCVEYFDLFCRAPHLVATWANATTQGAVVAKTMSGIKTLFEAVSSYTINFFGASCSFVGMTDRGFADEVISRGSVEDKRITRIFLKKFDNQTRIVGATVINAPNELSFLAGAIKNKVDVSSYKDKLTDIIFDLVSLENSG